MDEDPDLILPDEWKDTPIRALRATPTKKLAQFLDLDGYVIVGQNGTAEIDIVNDYNGLAELAGFSALEIRNLARKRSPTEELLLHWGMDSYDRATVGLLWKYLHMMERMDVIKDCRRAILNDCMHYEAERRREEAEDITYARILQDPAVSNSDMATDETRYATVDDVKTGVRTKYKAFVCYSPEERADREFVRDLIENIEVKHGLKLFVPGRDDLPGSAEHAITAYLIECRCERVMIVMSSAFLKSAACEFQMKFAQCLAPGARSKRLIPIIRHKNIQIPRILKFLALCDFTKLDMNDWAWDRLATTLKAPVGPSTYDDLENEPDSSEPMDLRLDLRDIRYPSQHTEPPSVSALAHTFPDRSKSVDYDVGSSSSNDAYRCHASSNTASFSQSLPDTESGSNLANSTHHSQWQTFPFPPISTNLNPQSRATQSEVQRRFKPASAQQFNSVIVRTGSSSVDSVETTRLSDTSQVTGRAIEPERQGQQYCGASQEREQNTREPEESLDDEKTVMFRDMKCRQT